jgi:hypothetical protein
MAPLASAVTTEASCAIAAGAADSALATGSDEGAADVVLVSAAAVLFSLLPGAALLQAAALITAPASSSMRKVFDVIDPSFEGRIGGLAHKGQFRDGSCLDSSAALCQLASMTIARISELERKTTQSGKANSGLWLLEFERQQPLRPDPLTGWNGSGDTNPQVRLNFPSKEAAIDYCNKHGLGYHIMAAAPARLKLQAYADNFR